MDEQLKNNLRGELRVLLGKMNLNDPEKVEKCIDILDVEPDAKEPAVVITDQPKKEKRKKNSGDPE